MSCMSVQKIVVVSFHPKFTIQFQQYTPSNKLNALAQPRAFEQEEAASQSDEQKERRMQFDLSQTNFDNGKVGIPNVFGVNVCCHHIFHP